MCSSIRSIFQYCAVGCNVVWYVCVCVFAGKTKESRKDNARYAITCARKLGAIVFVTFEGIAEVKPKMILLLLVRLLPFTFVAPLYISSNLLCFVSLSMRLSVRSLFSFKLVCTPLYVRNVNVVDSSQHRQCTALLFCMHTSISFHIFLCYLKHTRPL